MRERVKREREVLFEKQPRKRGNQPKAKPKMSTRELFNLRLKKFVNKQRSEEAERFTKIEERKRAEPSKLQRRSTRLARAAEKDLKVEEVKESPLKRRKLTDEEML